MFMLFPSEACVRGALGHDCTSTPRWLSIWNGLNTGPRSKGTLSPIQMDWWTMRPLGKVSVRLPQAQSYGETRVLQRVISNYWDHITTGKYTQWWHSSAWTVGSEYQTLNRMTCISVLSYFSLGDGHSQFKGGDGTSMGHYLFVMIDCISWSSHFGAYCLFCPWTSAQSLGHSIPMNYEFTFNRVSSQSQGLQKTTAWEWP